MKEKEDMKRVTEWLGLGEKKAIKLGFFGAAGEVTGSCYVITTSRAQVMVDMGMHQGERLADEHNRRLPDVDFDRLDAVVLTHGHLDHCGRLPMLIRNGYRSAIYCTPATADVTEIILRDSARLQVEDFERFMRHMRGKPAYREPLYNEQDVARTLPRLSTIEYQQAKQIAEGITIEFIDSGHILGAASVRMKVQDGERELTIVFSGDVGQTGAPIIRDPTTPTPADVVVLESTYGDHDHRSMTETRDEFLSILRDAQAANAKVLIPAFAVGRTQDLIFHLGEFVREGALKNLRVFVDSPMAVSVTQLYKKYKNLYDDEARKLLDDRERPLDFPGLRYIRTSDESRQLNDDKGCMLIIAASGMCTGGRIVHHLRHGLGNPRTHLVFVGYQGEGTLGRRLVDGARFVSLFGQDVRVEAKVHTLGGFSAHAGQSGLLDWMAPLAPSRPRVYLTHGEDIPRIILQKKLEDRFGLVSHMPYYGDEVEL
jgi:metallo-beta-lactamase family protein